MVRATVSSSSARMSPRMTVQRIRLWASTAHCSQAELAWKLPGGDVVEPGAFFEVADRRARRRRGDDGTGRPRRRAVEIGEEGVVTPVGPQPLLDLESAWVWWRLAGLVFRVGWWPPG